MGDKPVIVAGLEYQQVRGLSATLQVSGGGWGISGGRLQ
jgi:hypothetical protein